MGYSRLEYVYSGGAQTFAVNFALGYLEQDDVTVYVVGEVDGTGAQLYRDFTWLSEGEIQVTDPITTGSTVVLQRTVEKDTLEISVDHTGPVTRATLVRALKQTMMNIHELLDGRADAFTGALYDAVIGIRDTAIAAMNSALDAETGAEAAQAAAEAAQVAATASAVQADLSEQAAAGDAQAAEAARVAAVAAQAAAELAETAAQSYMDAASALATAADASATSAAASEEAATDAAAIAEAVAESVLELTGNTFDVRAWGLTGSGDETVEIQEMCQWAADNGITLIWPRDVTYEISELKLTGSHHWIGARLHSNKSGTPGNNEFAVEFQENRITEVDVTDDFNLGRSNLVVSDPSLVQPGDLVRIKTTRLIPTDDRGTWTEGQVVRVSSKGGTTLRLTDVLEYSYKNLVSTGTITAISADRYTLTCSDMPSGDGPLSNRRLMKITSGTAAGEERYIPAKSGNDAIHYDTWNNQPWPETLQVGDSYSYEVTSTAIVYRPNTIVLEDCQITRDLVYNETSGVRNHWGGVHAVAAHFTMRDSLIEGFPEVALKTSFCYEPLVENSQLRHANLCYDDYQGLGYGWLMATCHAPKAVDVTGFANRSNINFSGSSGYTTHGQAVRVTMVGGGKTYAGEYFWPTGNNRQAVASSHGTGLGTQYIDCVGRNVYAGHTLVGKGEQVKGYRHFGAGYRMVFMGAGALGATITDIAYDDEITMPDHNEYHTMIDTDKRLRYAVGIEYSGDWTFSQPITIRGVRANAVMEAGVFIDTRSNPEIRNLHVSDVYATCYPDSQDTYGNFRVVKFDEGVGLTGCTFDNLKFVVLTGSGSYTGNAIALSMIGSNADGAPVCWITDGGLVWIDGDAWTHVPDGSISRIPIISGTGAVHLNVENPRTGAGRPRAYGLVMEDKSSNNRNANAYSNAIELLAAWPTTSAAATSGNVGLHYNRENGSLSIVNNSGAGQTLIVSGL